MPSTHKKHFPHGTPGSTATLSPTQSFSKRNIHLSVVSLTRLQVLDAFTVANDYTGCLMPNDAVTLEDKRPYATSLPEMHVRSVGKTH